MPLAYLFATGLGGLIWLAFYLPRPDLRRVMLGMSLAGAPMALSDLFYVPQYWRPRTIGHIPVGIEGVLFSFEAGGICAVAYAVVFQRRFEPETSSLLPMTLRKAALKVSPLLTPPIVAAVIGIGLHTNMEWGLYVGLIAGTGLVASMRPDLTKAQIFGGLAFLPIYTAALVVWVSVFPSVHSWFTLWRMPHWYFLRVPVTEIVFGAIFAAYWTGLYPMVFEQRFTPLKKPSTEPRAVARPQGNALHG